METLKQLVGRKPELLDAPVKWCRWHWGILPGKLAGGDSAEETPRKPSTEHGTYRQEDVLKALLDACGNPAGSATWLQWQAAIGDRLGRSLSGRNGHWPLVRASREQIALGMVEQLPGRHGYRLTTLGRKEVSDHVAGLIPLLPELGDHRELQALLPGSKGEAITEEEWFALARRAGVNPRGRLKSAAQIGEMADTWDLHVNAPCPWGFTGGDPERYWLQPVAALEEDLP